MRRRLESWARPIAGLLILTLGLVTAAPAVAAEPAPAPAPQPLTLVAAATATVASMPIPAAALAQATPAPPAAATDSKGFFGTTAGRVALVLMAAGTGYMVYSAFKDNDPVKSQFR